MVYYFNCGNNLIGYLNIGYNLNLIITQWNQDSWEFETDILDFDFPMSLKQTVLSFINWNLSLTMSNLLYLLAYFLKGDRKWL